MRIATLAAACSLVTAVLAGESAVLADDAKPVQAGFPPAGRSDAVDAKADAPLDSGNGSLFQPKGMEFGKFLVLPSAELEEGWNSNVYATASNVKGDTFTEFKPELKLRSRFDQHALNMDASADAIRFNRLSSDNRVDGQLFVNGRYDLSRTSEINGSVLGAMGHEDRTSPDNANGKEPTPTRTLDANVGAATRGSQVTASGNLEGARYLFGNVNTSGGIPLLFSRRDRTEATVTAKGGYEFRPSYSAQLEASGNTRQYDSRLDMDGYRRDSVGYHLRTGVGIEVNDLIRGEFLMGWFQQSYKDPRLTNPQGVSLQATFNWTPSRLLLIVPSLSRSPEETTRIGASAMVHDNATLLVRYEYLPDVLITNTAALSYDEFSGLGGNNALTVEEHLRVMYAFTRQWLLGAHVDYMHKDSDAAQFSFDQTKAGLVAKVQF